MFQMSATRKSPDRQKNRRFALMCCTALCALPLSVYAQDTETTRLSPVIRLPEITLTASGGDDDENSIVAQELAVGGKVATNILDTPASVSVITQKEIERRDARTLEDVLEYTAGTITDYFGTDDRNDYFQIRGFDASTYRDGITLGGLRGIREEPLAYERVEVIRGANSTLFGAADPGGSINFVTKRPRAEKFSEVSGTIGSDNRKEIGFDFGDTLNPQATLSWRLTGKVQDSDREYDFSRDDETFLMGGLTWQPTDVTSVSVVVDYLERDATPNSGGYPRGGDSDRSLFLGEPDFNYLDVDRTTVNVFADHDFGGGLTLRSNLRYSDTSESFGYVYLNGDEGVFPISRDYFGTEASAKEIAGDVILQYDRDFGRVDSSTLGGIEYRDVSAPEQVFYGFGGGGTIDPRNPVYLGAPTNLEIIGDTKRDDRTRAIFVQQNLSLDDRFIATVGARHDKLDLEVEDRATGTSSSDDYSETTLRGALTWKVTPEISTYVSYAESVAPPDLGEEPARGEQYELGAKYQPLGINALFSAAIYDLEKSNITATDLSGGAPVRFLLGDIRVRGLDLETKAELGSGINLTAAYSYADSEVQRSATDNSREGNAPASVPNHIASLWVDYTLAGNGTRGDMTFGMGARYTGTYFYGAGNNTGKSEATVLLDAAYSYDIADSTQLSMNVQNLTDEKHVVGRGSADFYNPGRTVSATLRHRW